ncbi:OpgC domain-containing protein [Thaumasiovibrio sp. DFM-14]|uniref:OpgC domain-containing protein n=1 Tax=Thaumasiovibrio sp. DFM-14 TaxID=3384792 RepID=UPI0039A1679F
MKRIPALDSIRGLLLVLMTINHLIWISGGRSILQLFTQQPLGQFGSAEGFVFISALLAGAIYSKPSLTSLDVRKKAFSRAFTIYRYHLLCLLAVCGWVVFCVYNLPSTRHLMGPNLPNILVAPLETSILSALLINKPNYFDILPLYVLFMLILPVAIAAYRRGLMWLVLLISIGIWLASGSISDAMLLPLFKAISPEMQVQTGYFDPFAWQLLFIAGSALGYLQHKESFSWRHPALTVVALIIAALLFVAHHGAFAQYGIHQGVLYSQASKPELGWLRLLNLATWVYLIALIIESYPKVLVFRPLSYLGRHSLHVFSWQAVLIYVAAPFLNEIRYEAVYLIAVALLTATLWIPAWQRESKSTAATQQRNRLLTATAFLALIAVNFGLVNSPAPTVDSAGVNTGPMPLTIEIKQLVDQTSPVFVMVYDEKDDLMGGASVHARPYSVEEVTQGVTIEELAAGHYAIFAFQDTDQNMTLSFGAGGIPSEGFGYSNDPLLQGMPTMDQIKFAHNAPQTQTIRMNNF